ncbi:MULTISPECIES: hypothetical protein [Sphingobacterium]|uniref:Uncharacterized protein n=1 Tax=Sphingobacterium phlebotomi TaxID=2605433 RepID=A0A5D4H6B2_9SPHI|nr:MULTISPECIES: hypothetical protein [Sphingobacterium]NGM67314.1 hypothetical protein [Sphingobacterium sp. SGR-19]TYR36157.1 hypothetical protein FXV77_09565 [Sphingobacterium phlebotomi]
MNIEKTNNWKLMKSFLKKRRKDPWANPSYVLYFLIVIVLVGTFGVLKDIIEMQWCWFCGFDDIKVKNFSFNVTNISLSLVTASVIDLIFITKKTVRGESAETDELRIESIKKSIRIFGLGSLIVTFVIWIIVNNFIAENIIKIILSIICLLFSYFIWWISSVRNKILHDRFNPFNTLGKERTNNSGPENPNGGREEGATLSGNITDFKVD